MYKCTVKTYNLLNSIWQTVDLCVSVFSNDMHSSSLGARPGGFLCRHKLSSQCALHNHHNLNNLGIRQEIWQNLFGKIDFRYAGEATHPIVIIVARTLFICYIGK